MKTSQQRYHTSRILAYEGYLKYGLCRGTLAVYLLAVESSEALPLINTLSLSGTFLTIVQWSASSNV